MNGIPERLSAVFAPGSPTRVVAEHLAAEGHRTYLVGGSVRDAFANRVLGDLDLTTSARPDDIERLIAPIAEHVWLQGKAFGTIGARVGGHDLEITTFRGDLYRPESRKPEVDYADDVE
ncbi:MAG: CCA tRNA nucleotidyltransferase, partial [Acidimicrobiia bacterium]|nr:CCA tRNA nucleotidyltransferase [Acidimicrobiia bacterium]